MRLLHTSDWHLGQSLHNFERSHEHQSFLDWLLATIENEQADALLIAGDIFDTANPSAAAQKQLYRFLQQSRQRAPRMEIVIIAGNHDSPGRLEAPAPLLEAHGISVIGHVARRDDGDIDIERLLVPLHDATGQVRAWCIAIPFLRPGDVPRVASEDGADPYQAGIALLYQQATALAQARCSAGQAIVAMGHCHMVGGQSSDDSERRIVIGGAQALPSSVFGPSVAYAALGHLHLAQRVGQQERVRYSGSPLPLSFAEVGYTHQVLRVDLDGAALRAVTPLPVPRAVELLRVPPKPVPVDEALAALAALTCADLPLHEQPLLEVRILQDAPQPGLRARVEAALAGKAIRLAKIELTQRIADSASGDALLTLDQLAALAPDDIFKRLYQQRYGSDAPPDLLGAFHELLSGDDA